MSLKTTQVTSLIPNLLCLWCVDAFAWVNPKDVEAYANGSIQRTSCSLFRRRSYSCSPISSGFKGFRLTMLGCYFGKVCRLKDLMQAAGDEKASTIRKLGFLALFLPFQFPCILRIYILCVLRSTCTWMLM